ncbi:MAG: hypothetical protein FJ115_00110 [Deltaproteobacteria bacterium]|nr:hypothetical protein [Deltaproteobacteria bacterium]MBM4321932.1 hypothetical protein [Deltaproteobacteria bacterium]
MDKLEQDRLIIIVCTVDNEIWKIIRGKMRRQNAPEIFWTNGVVIKVDVKEEDFDYNLVYIDQENSGLKKKLENIINGTMKERICIAAHKSKRTNDHISVILSSIERERCEGRTKVCQTEPLLFHREAEEYFWSEGLLPLLKKIGEKDYRDYYDRLWKLFLPGLDIALFLREKLMTIMVAYDLISQAKSENPLFSPPNDLEGRIIEGIEKLKNDPEIRFRWDQFNKFPSYKELIKKAQLKIPAMKFPEELKEFAANLNREIDAFEKKLMDHR